MKQTESEVLYYIAEREGYAIVRALLREDLENGDTPQQALSTQIMKEPADIAPWHVLPSALDGCRAGMLRAVISFLLENFDEVGEFSAESGF